MGLGMSVNMGFIDFKSLFNLVSILIPSSRVIFITIVSFTQFS